MPILHGPRQVVTTMQPSMNVSLENYGSFSEPTVITPESRSKATEIALSICAVIIVAVIIGVMIKCRWYRKCWKKKKTKRKKVRIPNRRNKPITPPRIKKKTHMYREDAATLNVPPGMKGYEIPMKSVNTTPEVDCYVQPMRPQRENFLHS